MLSAPALAAPDGQDWPKSATDADLRAAFEVLQAWTGAFREGRFDEQWGLVDPRIRRWIKRERWRKAAKKSTQRNKLLDYEIIEATAALGAQLPCTEQRHCHRPDVRYVVFLIRSKYANDTPPQPEYAAISLSEEGWRFGGGTFPDRPLGETAVIMTREDEEKYSLDENEIREALRLRR